MVDSSKEEGEMTGALTTTLLVVFLLVAFVMIAPTMLPDNMPAFELPRFEFAAPAPQQAQMSIGSAVQPAQEIHAFGAEPFAATLEGNWWLSTRHPESFAIASGLLQSAGHSMILNQKGDRCGPQASSGHICIYAGMSGLSGGKGGIANFAILNVVGKYVAFAVVQADAIDVYRVGWARIGDTQFYYNPASLGWKCAWWMAARTQNGHRIPPESEMLTVGKSWTEWAVVQQRYQLVVPVASVHLPAWNQQR